MIKSRNISKKRELVNLRQRFIEYAVQEYIRKYHHNDDFKKSFERLPSETVIKENLALMRISFCAENDETLPRNWEKDRRIIEKIAKAFEEGKNYLPKNDNLNKRFSY